MLHRWLERRRWRRSSAFDDAVAQTIEEIESLYGPQALEQARRKAKRRHQKTRRKWIWREAVRRMEAQEMTGQA